MGRTSSRMPRTRSPRPGVWAGTASWSPVTATLHPEQGILRFSGYSSRDMKIKTSAVLAISALALSLPIAACGNDDGFRRDDSKLDLDPGTKLPKDLAEVKDPV